MEYIHLQFKKIHTTSLEVNKKYLVVFYEGNTIRKLKGYYIKRSPTEVYVCFCMSSLVFNALRYFLDVSTSFYDIEYKKTNIQNAMEQRAINKLLQRITGDPTFNY